LVCVCLYLAFRPLGLFKRVIQRKNKPLRKGGNTHDCSWSNCIQVPCTCHLLTCVYSNWHACICHASATIANLLAFATCNLREKTRGDTKPACVNLGSAGLGSVWQTTSSLFIVDPTKPKDESLQSVCSTGLDIRSRDVDTLCDEASYGNSYARGFSKGSIPKPGDPTEN
jgi:hypothetical protein